MLTAGSKQRSELLWVGAFRSPQNHGLLNADAGQRGPVLDPWVKPDLVARSSFHCILSAAGGKVTACTVCHGRELRGMGPVPTLAGRSPSYAARQLYDTQKGNRNGLWTPLMAPVVADLAPEDLLNAAAYLASLQP